MAKIPTILEPGRADGKLAFAENIFNASDTKYKDKFQSEINMLLHGEIQGVAKQGRMFPTLATAQSKITEPAEGDWVIITATTPAKVYAFDGTIWQYSGIKYEVGPANTTDQITDTSIGATQNVLNAESIYADDNEADEDPIDNLEVEFCEESSYAYNWKTTDGPAGDGKTEGNLKDLYQSTIDLNDKITELKETVGFFNVNDYNRKIDSYPTWQDAIDAIPEKFRTIRLVILAYVANEWKLKQFFGGNLSVWNANAFTDVIQGGVIKDGSITEQKLADYSISKYKLAINSVSNKSIIDGNITTDKIADNQITTSKLVNLSVTTEKIDNSSITKDKLANSSVTNTKIMNGNITTEKIADGQITKSKLSTDVVSSLDNQEKALETNYQTIILDGHYLIDTNGNKSDESVFYLTNEFNLKKGEHIGVEYQGTGYSVLSKVSGGNYTPVLIAKGTGKQYSEYVADSDCTIVACSAYQLPVITFFSIRIEKKQDKPIIVAKDGSGDYTKLKDAVDYSNLYENIVIYVKEGEYNIIEEFGDAYFNAISSTATQGYNGMILKNNVHIIGLGNVILKANYQGSNNGAKATFSIFNVRGSFLLENFTLDITNCRYCIHDDGGSLSHASKCINCKMVDNGNDGSNYSYHSCYGGGTFGINSVTVVDGCEFWNNHEGPLKAEPFSFHSHSSAPEYHQRIIVSNCYFHTGQTVATEVQSAGSWIELIVRNNKLGATRISTGSGKTTKLNVIEYNNIVE